MEQEISSINIERNKFILLDKVGCKYIKDVTDPSREFIFAKTPPKTKTALELLEYEYNQKSVLSHINQLDKILENEIVPGTITEFAGLAGTGKTQLCFQLCVSVQLIKLHGDNRAEAIYIGTNRNFSKERLREIAVNFIEKHPVECKDFYNADEILKHVFYTEANTCTELFSILNNLSEFINSKNVYLLIIDSVSFPLKQTSFDSRRPTIGKLFKTLRSISNIHNLAVVITNDVTTRIRHDVSYETPSFGDSFYHCINTRIITSKVRNTFLAKLVKSAYQAPQIVQFNI
ncbi:DNA repair protein RAD51 homolog 3 [Aethina tumida]|uniref:DNA repair protein RAD51 homolog 3 n=1 Tax=Aethina tumida TaxID=116153 RepID=UPI002147ABF6|nr:DNA repair protein RAD51 homolog 3 [Aethina tumida]